MSDNPSIHSATQATAKITTAKRTRARLMLVVLFAMFFVPVFGAILVAVVAPHWIPFGGINHGELIRPPIAGAVDGLLSLDEGPTDQRGHDKPWLIVHVGPPVCDADCEYALVQMRQARLALGKDAHRVERWWLMTQRPQRSTVIAMKQDFPGLRMGLLPATSPLIGGAARKSVVQMIDPVGFLILHYPSDWRERHQDRALASALHKDFKRLLKISKQG